MTPVALIQQPLCPLSPALAPGSLSAYSWTSSLLSEAFSQAGLGEGHSYPVSPKKVPGADQGMGVGLVAVSKDGGGGG